MKVYVKKSVKTKHNSYVKTQRYTRFKDYARQRRNTKKNFADAQASYRKKIMKEVKQKPNYVRA